MTTNLIVGLQNDRQVVEGTHRSMSRPRRHFGSHTRRFLSRHPMILFGVICPTLVVAAYYLTVAAPVYVSESKFVVRMSSPPSHSQLGAMLQSSGITRSQDDTFSVSDFLLSRDALRQLDEHQPLRDMFAAPTRDFMARYPRPWDNDSFEGLYRYYLSNLDVIHNASTGITTLRTRAFSASDAHTLNTQLLSAAGDLLVRLNNRAREDAVSFARREVGDAEKKLLDIQDGITAFRNNEMMIDPTRVSVLMLDMIGRLSTELAMTRARRAEALSAAPDSASVPNLTSRIAALEDQIDLERGKLVGKDVSVSAHITEYERLTLMREMAAKTLALATASLETARADARRQQLYLETIVQPNSPDEALEPTATTNVLITFLLGAVLSLIAWVLLAAASEHRQNRRPSPSVVAED
jgi:capsular polysaccharide transport system permease protein